MTVLNIAHRGARSLAPENTLAAARRGLELGADLWETDVVATADGELILMHDDTLERTTDATRQFPDRAPWMVTTLTLEEIRSLDAGTWFIETDPFGQIEAGEVTPGELLSFSCLNVPTLREALHFTQTADWRVNLELKRIPPPLQDFPIVERVLDLIGEMGVDRERIIISSYNHDWLHQMQRLAPDIAIQALVGTLNLGQQPAFETYNASSIMVTPEEVQAATARGLTVNLYTVNETEVMQRFIQAGVAGLFTDFPQRLKAIL